MFCVHPSQVHEEQSSPHADHPLAGGRRVRRLGLATSSDAASADCSRQLDVQLPAELILEGSHLDAADGSDVLSFASSVRSCESGRAFSGSTSDGRMHVTLVPGAGGAFAASVTDDETGAVYSISPDASGEMTVVVKMQDEYGMELDPEDGMSPEERSVFERRMAAEGGRELGTTPANGLRGKVADETGDEDLRPDRERIGRDLEAVDPDATFDILVVWTRHSECRNSQLSRGCTLTAATEANMRARIDLAVAETNVAYAESGILARLNLVHAYRDATYVEASFNAFAAALNAVTSTADGVMDDVHDRRAEHGADVVAMIIDDLQYCGYANIGPRADLMFSVTAWNCATGYYSFGHEIAHNLGCMVRESVEGSVYLQPSFFRANNSLTLSSLL